MIMTIGSAYRPVAGNFLRGVHEYPSGYGPVNINIYNLFISMMYISEASEKKIYMNKKSV